MQVKEMHVSRGASPFIIKAGMSPFFYESRHVSHSVYRETSVRMAHLHFVSPLKRDPS
jgi:hypothetical protein